MHQPYSDMLSFYVAGSLSPSDVMALEQHLRTCVECRASLDEWREIADVVRAEADVWSRNLPPLSPEVRASVYARRATQDDSRPMRVVETRQPAQRRMWGGLTLVAAVFTLVIFGGALAYMVNQNGDIDDTSTQVAMAQASETAASREATAEVEGTPAPQASPRSTREDLGIIEPTSPISPTATPQPTEIASRPTEQATRQTTSLLTPTPPELGFTGSIPAPTTTMIPGLCGVFSAFSEGATLYQRANADSGIVGILAPNDLVYSYVQSGDGWYELFRPGEGWLGWARSNELVFGGTCDGLPQPTATITDDCTLTTGANALNMRSGPGADYDIINAVSPFDFIAPLSQSDNGWLRIRYMINGVMWLGWVPFDSVGTSVGCVMLPVITSAGYAPEATPIFITPTWTPTPELPPTVTNTPDTVTGDGSEPVANG